MRLSILSLVLAATLPALPALAQDLAEDSAEDTAEDSAQEPAQDTAQGLIVYGGAALAFDNAEEGQIGSNVNVYVEGEIQHVYFGVSGDLNNVPESNAIDLYLGYRNETAGGFSYDISYDRSYFPNDGGDCCGTVALSVGAPLSDTLALTVDANYYPEDQLSDAYMTLDYILNDKVTLTAAIGVVQQEEGAAAKDYELAVAYQLSEETAVALHYHNGSDYDGYFALDLTWDTTLLGG